MSNVTPGAAAYGLASVMPSLLPDGHMKDMAARVSSVSGIRMAARIQLAFFRAANI
ncbi:hypothetical protein SRABI128_05944 [Microbacterium sp. Bi128]|nr:hypothetical protein SRABI128_05944 [Microbacterium sp. Bi128]